MFVVCFCWGAEFPGSLALEASRYHESMRLTCELWLASYVIYVCTSYWKTVNLLMSLYVYLVENTLMIQQEIA